MRKLPLPLCSIFFVFAILVGGLFSAHAATFYVDLGSALPARIPSSTYGGTAALGAGDWNGIATSPTNLFDIDGNSTSVSLSAVGGWTTSGAPSTDSERLFWDCIDRYINSYSLTFTNLTNGEYDVYLYAWYHPTLYTGTGAINVNGNPVPEFFSGFQSLRTTVSSGTLAITGTPNGFTSNFARLAGVQVSAVPIPGALWLLGSGVIGIAWIRRKFKK